MEENKIKYYVLKLDNEFLPNYLIEEMKKLITSDMIGFKLKWRNIVDILIRSEPKQRIYGNRMELYEKYIIIKKKNRRRGGLKNGGNS